MPGSYQRWREGGKGELAGFPAILPLGYGQGMEDSRILRWLKYALLAALLVSGLVVSFRPELLRTGVASGIPVTIALLFLGWLTNDPYGD